VDYTNKTVIVEKKNRVATITLNRPERLNAVGDGMHEELEDIFGRINSDDEVNAIILTGAGRAFCAGGDIRGMASGPAPADGASTTNLAFSRGPRRLIMNMLEVEAPIITAMNGDAVGLGEGDEFVFDPAVKQVVGGLLADDADEVS